MKFIVDKVGARICGFGLFYVEFIYDMPYDVLDKCFDYSV
jgi:hypothetical protein